MKNLILLFAIYLCGCSAINGSVDVEVSNPSDFARKGEVVEVLWRDVQQCAALPDNVLVCNAEGEEIPSQLVFNEEGGLVSILFQADVAANATAQYKISRGKPQAYEPKVYGRYVPERMDDYAWENNLTAYRIYGPSLKDPLTQGIDVWVKNTQKLIINEWFAKNDYHHNYGEGMDCYKVGNTLGGGALAIVDGEELHLSGNYLTQRCTMNGPLRTSAEFEYAPVEVAGQKIVMRRTITLDADSRFSRQEYVFNGFEGEIEVAAGVVLHDVKARADGDDYVAVTEATSDTKDPVRDGNISLAVVLDDGKASADIQSHAVVKRRIKAGEKVVMLNGSGWSQGGVASHAEWQVQVAEAAAKVAQPLTVEVCRNRKK